MVINPDGFVKRPSAVLCTILPRFSAGQAYCGVLPGTPHSSGFARLASELFTVPFHLMNYYYFINP